MKLWVCLWMTDRLRGRRRLRWNQPIGLQPARNKKGKKAVFLLFLGRSFRLRHCLWTVISSSFSFPPWTLQASNPYSAFLTQTHSCYSAMNIQTFDFSCYWGFHLSRCGKTFHLWSSRGLLGVQYLGSDPIRLPHGFCVSYIDFILNLLR